MVRSRFQRSTACIHTLGKLPTTVQFAVIFIKEGRRSVYQFEDKEQRGHGSKAKAQLRAIPGEVLGLECRITTDGLLGFSLMTLYFLYFEAKETLVQDFTRRPSAHPEDWSHGLQTTASRLLQSYIELEGWRSKWSLGENCAAHYGACWTSNSTKKSLRKAPSRIQTPVIILGFASWAPITTVTSSAKAEPWEATLTWHWSALF